MIIDCHPTMMQMMQQGFEITPEQSHPYPTHIHPQ